MCSSDLRGRAYHVYRIHQTSQPDLRQLRAVGCKQTARQGHYHRDQQGLLCHGQTFCHVDQYPLRHQGLLANDLPTIIQTIIHNLQIKKYDEHIFKKESDDRCMGAHRPHDDSTVANTPHRQKHRDRFEMERYGQLTRLEERRVGKECRSRWSPYH